MAKAPLVVRWWRRRGLRSRVTLTAALGLIVAFAAADLLLFNALQVSLTRSVDDYARSGATEVAALINADRLPDPVPVAAGTITIQVLDAAGRITDVSPDADRLVPIVPAAQAAALANDGGAVLVRGAPFDMPSLLRVAAVLLTAVAVTVSGPIAFVALTAPQIARRLTRSTGPGMVAAACCGAAVLVVADLVAQYAVPGVVYPVGVVTAALGGVYLAFLLVREWRRSPA